MKWLGNASLVWSRLVCGKCADRRLRSGRSRNRLCDMIAHGALHIFNMYDQVETN